MIMSGTQFMVDFFLYTSLTTITLFLLCIAPTALNQAAHWVRHR